MPARTPTRKPKPKSNDDLYELVTGRVLPELAEVKTVAYEARDLAKKAGLNGYGADIHDYFEQRAEQASAKKWLVRKLRPVARFKVLVYVVGFFSTIAWGAIAVIDLLQLLKPAHFPGG